MDIKDIMYRETAYDVLSRHYDLSNYNVTVVPYPRLQIFTYFEGPGDKASITIDHLYYVMSAMMVPKL